MTVERRIDARLFAPPAYAYVAICSEMGHPNSVLGGHFSWRIRTLLALAIAGLVGAASGQALTRGSNPCNGQAPCVSMHIGSAYAAPATKLLCLYDRDFENKPQVFCGPANQKGAAFVSITATRIEVIRATGSKLETLYSVAR